MKLLLHKMWFDLRDVRWPWAAWWLILILQVVCCRLFFYDALFFDARIVSAVMWGGQILAGAQFVLRLFKLDAIHSPSAFWISRPIRPMSLLVGKVVLALLGLLIPMLIARAACMGLMSLPLVDAHDWAWPITLSVFAVALCGVSVWGTTTYWRSGLVGVVLILLTVLGPHGILNGLEYVIQERSPGAAGFSSQVWLVVERLDRSWRLLWIKIEGVTIISAFLFSILAIACVRRRPINLAVLLFGALTVNAGWMLSHVDPNSAPSPTIIWSDSDPLIGLRSAIVDPPVTIKISDPIPTELIKNAEGKSVLAIRMKLPPIPGIPRGCAFSSADASLSFSLPENSPINRLQDYSLSIDGSEQLVSREDLLQKGFPASEVDAFLRASPPLLRNVSRSTEGFVNVHSKSSNPRVGSLVLSTSVRRFDLVRIVGPFKMGSGRQLREGVRINYREFPSSVCLWLPLLESQGLNLNFMEVITGGTGPLSVAQRSFNEFKVGSNQLNMPMINLGNLVGYQNFWGNHLIDLSDPKIHLMEFGPLHHVQLVIEAEFELPETWWGIDLK